jgi:hypothetical protein
MSLDVYRVQAQDGRGPWRPGFSKYWIDEDSQRPLQLDVVTAFGLVWLNKIPRGWSAGCGCRTIDALFKWFTPTEQRRLADFGYTPVLITADKIIEENADQVIFARRRPFNESVIVMKWQHEFNPLDMDESVCAEGDEP